MKTLIFKVAELNKTRFPIAVMAGKLIEAGAPLIQGANDGLRWEDYRVNGKLEAVYSPYTLEIIFTWEEKVDNKG